MKLTTKKIRVTDYYERKKHTINYVVLTHNDIMDGLTKEEAFKEALRLHNEGVKDIEVMTACDTWENGYASLSTYYSIDQIQTELLLMEFEKELKKITKG